MSLLFEVVHSPFGPLSKVRNLKFGDEDAPPSVVLRQIPC